MSAVELRRWTRQEYERLVEVGILRPDEQVELIDGGIVMMAPQHSRHAVTVTLVEDALRGTFGPGYYVRAQLPLALGPQSEPEPDVAVVTGSPRDYVDAHPATAVLVVEIADTTLSFDRDVKGSLYAKAGIPDYWIANLLHHQLEVYRDPGPVPDAKDGFGYRSRTVFVPGDTVCPLGRSSARVAVADLLP